MKKTIKTLSCIIAALTLISSAVGLGSAEALHYKNHSDFVYIETLCSDNENEWTEVTITNYKGNKKTLSFPETIGGNPVVEIGALKKAKNLKKVHIHKDITYFSTAVQVLDKITVDKNNKKYFAKNNSLFMTNEYGTTLVKCPKNTKTAKIPASVDFIGDRAFEGTKISKVTLPKNVISIDGEAFKNCKKLKTAKLNSKLEELHSHAFKNCKSLTSLKLPKSLTWLGSDAFGGCKKLEKIYIYSKNCKISFDADAEHNNAIPSHVTIYGYKGSTAQKYAKKNGNDFVVIKAK